MSGMNAVDTNWLRVLGKGMVTIPKSWREEFGIREGEVVLAKKTKRGILIEPIKRKRPPYRVYSQKELEEFLKEDQLSEKVLREVDKKLKAL